MCIRDSRRGGPRRQEATDSRRGQRPGTERQKTERRQTARHRYVDGRSLRTRAADPGRRRRRRRRGGGTATATAVPDDQVDDGDRVGEDADGEQVLVVTGRVHRQCPGQLDPQRAERQVRADGEQADEQ